MTVFNKLTVGLMSAVFIYRCIYRRILLTIIKNNGKFLGSPLTINNQQEGGKMYSDMDARLAALEERLGVKFNNRDLLLEAVTHRSYLNENRNHPTPHNEILEFLGDAALELAVTAHLVHKFGGMHNEGTLTKWRAALVNIESLTKVGEFLKLQEVMLLSRGQAMENNNSSAFRRIIGCAVEAIFGVIFLDQGQGTVRMVVDALLHTRFSEIVNGWGEPKSEFQKLAQDRQGITPTYQVVDEWSQEHARHFKMAVYVGDVKVAEGEGLSKKEAENKAAGTALRIFQAS